MLQIVDYSERAIAVIGTEKGDQEQITALKSMKGKYNPSLRCGKGWVFSKAKNGEQVAKWVAQYNAAHSDSAPASSPEQTPPPPADTDKDKAAQTQTIAPAKVTIPIAEDSLMSELEGAPF